MTSPGLNYLSSVDTLLVHQQIEFLEVFTGFETNNKYVVKNSVGQTIFFAAEDTDCCTRCCCGARRPFDMAILDNYQRMSMEVSAPPGTVIGYVKQQWSLCKPCYNIKNADGDVVLKIKGPFCTCSICGDVEFNVFDGETKVGKIAKKWSGFVREQFTNADNFGINFPMELDVNIKAVLLGACFLIDFMFFENTKNVRT